MNKKKELIKNIIIFGIGTFGTKVMQMLLVPLYTIYMTTGEFGVADIINSTNSLVSPILTLGLGNGILRYLLGKRENDKPAAKLVVCVSFGGTLVLVLLLPVFSRISFFGDYYYFIPMLYGVTSLKMYLSQICKAKEKNIIYAIDGIFQTIILTIFCIIFIAKLKWGVEGYLYSIVISNFLSIIYFCIFINFFDLLKSSKIDKKLSKEMMKYSLPLIPNELSWWVIQMSDRYMVIYFCGDSLNGIYSMAYKIPGIFNLLVSIFIQAFGISAIKECDTHTMIDGKVDGSFFEAIYKSYLALTFIAVVVVILLSKPLSFVFLKNDFFQAWKFIPLLLIAFAIGNLQSFYGSILSGIKKTGVISQSTVLGMIVNVALNLLLIPYINAYGAAIATIISYFVVYLVRLNGISKYIKMKNYVFDTILSIVAIILISALYIWGSKVSIICSIVVSVLLLIYYKNTIVEGFQILKNLIIKIRQRKNVRGD